VIDFDVAFGEGTAEDKNRLLADHLYNRAIEDYSANRFDSAEALLVRAMELRAHPDYDYFYGLCRLMNDDLENGLRALRRVRDQQFARQHPFWPVPVSPRALRDAIAIGERGAHPLRIVLKLRAAQRRYDKQSRLVDRSFSRRREHGGALARMLRALFRR
jgi:hypothetical protein